MKTALIFVRRNVAAFFENKGALVDVTHSDLIRAEAEEEDKRFESALIFVKESAGKPFFHLSDNEEIPDVIRSALEEYLDDTANAKLKTGSVRLDKKIEEIKKLANSDFLKDSKTELFGKYFPDTNTNGKKNKEVFISYSTKDKALAGELVKELEERGIHSFLAHEDIEVTEEWRQEILKHLKNDWYLVSLLTDNYEVSTFGNQEAGYMMGKGGKNISLIVSNADVKRFGFLESFQGIKIEPQNIKECVDQIIELLFKSNER